MTTRTRRSPSDIEPFVAGHSALGSPIVGWRTRQSQSARPLLVMGAVHGDEIESLWLANFVIAEILKGSQPLLAQAPLVIVPCMNPDGVLMSSRWNANNVDLNRNLPTTNWSPNASDPRYPPGSAPASEPETQTFLEIFRTVKPTTIISLHSYTKELVLFPTLDGSGRTMVAVQKYAESISAPVVSEMSYKIFGSLSAFGRENSVETVTIELFKGCSKETIIRERGDALLQFLIDLSRAE